MRIESFLLLLFGFLVKKVKEKEKKRFNRSAKTLYVNAMKLYFCYMGCLENDMHAFQFNIPCCLDFIVS